MKKLPTEKFEQFLVPFNLINGNWVGGFSFWAERDIRDKLYILIWFDILEAEWYCFVFKKSS